MIHFILRRLGFVCLTVLLSSAIIFFATQVLPGDLATMILGRFASEEARANLRGQLGLDRPMIVQYGSWLWGFVRGDWGASLSTGQDVLPITLTRLGNSAILMLAGVLLYVPIGIVLGLLAAVRRNKLTDHVISIGSLSFIGLPEFVTALILIEVFAIHLKWLPAVSGADFGGSVFEMMRQLALPAITISLANIAYIARMTRSSTVDALTTDYVRTARLKGLGPGRVLFTHVLRNALLPTVTVVAIGVGWLIGGLIITESVFSYPGLGRLLLFGIQRRDVPLIQATTLLIVVIFCVSNLVADVLYAYLNPRIRYT
jgi:peptide/nickel transport system permease protein